MLTTINFFFNQIKFLAVKPLANKRLFNKAISLAVAVLCLLTTSVRFVLAQSLNTGTHIAKPKLVVFLIADQFPVNYLSSCLDKSQNGGFKYLLEKGANFTACHYSAATNQTADNMAAITSSSYPWSSGIIGDQWYDRHKQKVVSCATSETAKTLEADNNGILPGTTLGDELKIASNGSRIITITDFNQAAVLLSGKFIDYTFWLDSHTGNVAGSCRSGQNLPSWLSTFNDQLHNNPYIGKSWKPLTQNETAPDYAGNDATGAKAFAHTIEENISLGSESVYSQLRTTPWPNNIIFDFTREAINQESLGKHGCTDLLTVSFSAFGSVAKKYGNYSVESLDLALRFDEQLLAFLQFLDQKIGRDNCLIIFTACHGTRPPAEIPPIQGTDTNVVEAKSFREQLNSALSSRLGNANWIEDFEPPYVYFNLNAIDHSNFHQPDVEKLAAKLARSIKGTAETYGAFQLFMNELPNGPLLAAVRKSYFWGRSGELYVIPKPGFAFISDNDGTICGSPYTYDTAVPLIIYGKAVNTGTYASSSEPVDIAPTIANILGICPPSLSEGRVLSEAISSTTKFR